MRIASQEEVAAREFERGFELAQSGEGDFGLLQMALALERTPEECPALKQTIRANLSSWEGNLLRRRAVLDLGKGDSATAHFSPDGQLVLTTGSDDRSARLWEASTGRLIDTFGNHRNIPRLACFSPSGRLFATGDSDIHVRETSTRRLVLPVIDATGTAHRLFFSGDDRLFVVDQEPPRLCVWDVAGQHRIDVPGDIAGGRAIGFAEGAHHIIVIDKKSRRGLAVGPSDRRPHPVGHRGGRAD